MEGLLQSSAEVDEKETPLGTSVAVAPSATGPVEKSSSISGEPSVASRAVPESQTVANRDVPELQQETSSSRSMSGTIGHMKDRVHEGGDGIRRNFDARKANFKSKVFSKFGKVCKLLQLQTRFCWLYQQTSGTLSRACNFLWCAGTSRCGELDAWYSARHSA